MNMVLIRLVHLWTQAQPRNADGESIFNPRRTPRTRLADDPRTGPRGAMRRCGSVQGLRCRPAWGRLGGCMIIIIVFRGNLYVTPPRGRDQPAGGLGMPLHSSS